MTGDLYTYLNRTKMKSIVIDCHYHYDDEVVSAIELIYSMDSSGVHRTALMAPMNAFIAPPGKFTAKLICSFLSRPLLRSVPGKVLTNFTDDGRIRLPGGTYDIFSDPDNESVFKIVERYPDRFLGWVFINPRSENDQMKVLGRWIHSKSCIGVKAHPFWHRYPLSDLAPTAALLEKLNKTLLVHCGFRPHDDFTSLVDEFPDLKLILAHAAFPYYSSVWKKIRERRNIYVDLSQISYVNERITRDAVEYLGVNRCLFGTDGPTGTLGSTVTYDYGYLKRRIERIFPDDDVRRKLLGENFAELIGLR
jgi:uncharacterized protein